MKKYVIGIAMLTGLVVAFQNCTGGHGFSSLGSQGTPNGLSAGVQSAGKGGEDVADHPFAPSRPISGQYIVTFKDSVGDAAAESDKLMAGNGGRKLHTYSHTIKGFSAQLPDAAVEALRNNPNVESVEQDMAVSLQATQSNATWGLDRIDQRTLPLDLNYNYNSTGAGVHAFIVDTGIRGNHIELDGRLLPGFSAIADGRGTADCNGHGTHVAGTVGGTTYGVAKGVSLIPVRVLDCAGSGAWSGVIAGLDYVGASPLRPAVANLSLGGAASDTVDAAVAALVAKGVTVVVAAGNDNADACTQSPARVPSAITVGATNNMDSRASFSNWGPCVDIFAPGGGITSAWYATYDAYNILSGTSMASPHVAGAAALGLQANPAAIPDMIASQIVAGATKDQIIAATLWGPGTKNLLLYSLYGDGSAPAPAPGPAPAPSQIIAVKSILGSSAKSGSGWRASAVVAVYNVSSNALVANVTVNGKFSVGGNASCVTDSTGSCKLTSSLIKRNAGTSTTLSINSLSGTSMTYDASRNLQSSVGITAP